MRSAPAHLARAAARRSPAPPLAVRSFSASSSTNAKITLEVDGVPVTVEQGTALIQACEQAGESPSLSPLPHHLLAPLPLLLLIAPR